MSGLFKTGICGEGEIPVLDEKFIQIRKLLSFRFNLFGLFGLWLR